MLERDTAVVLVGWLALAGFVLAFIAPPTDAPGMYYDEAFLAQQARDFVDVGRHTTHPPSTRSTWILGRQFPLQNAAYLGSLKSQLLIPALALFGSSLATVRIATLCTALLGLLFSMLWIRRICDARVALLGGAIAAFDPSFVFFGEYEWGPYTTLLLCRGAGFYCVTEGWLRRRTGLLCTGGLCLGLGVYARADFAVILAAALVALLAVRGRTLLPEIRRRRGPAALAAGALLVGATPMLLSILDVLRTGGDIAGRGGLAYKAQVLWSTLDGSGFYRVLAAGGRFEDLFATEAPADWLAVATCASVAWLGWQLRPLLRTRELGSGQPAIAFLLLFAVILTVGMSCVPGAVRAHHMLNLLPLPHVLVAAALLSLARSTAARIAVAVAAAAIVATEVRVTTITRQFIADTGGRGRFSVALNDFAAELESDPNAVAVSLDWGFHEPLQFLTASTPLREPIWQIPRLLQRGQAWRHHGDARHHYLVHDEPYDLFQLGPKFLSAARALDPGSVEIRVHRDRSGAPAFYSARFSRPHQLIYTGEFSVQFQ